jgi:hypothetical protein
VEIAWNPHVALLLEKERTASRGTLLNSRRTERPMPVEGTHFGRRLRRFYIELQKKSSTKSAFLEKISASRIPRRSTSGLRDEVVPTDLNCPLMD